MSITLKQLRHDELHPSPNNTREKAGDVSDLADSIAGSGVIQPINARANDDGFEIITGFRRWTAIGKLIDDGRATPDDTWPVLVRKGADAKDDVSQAANIVENLYRQDVSIREEFNGLARLAGVHGWTAEEIAEATGLSKSVVKERLRWMVFTDEQLDRLWDNHVHYGSITELAKCSVAEITELFKSDKTGYTWQNEITSLMNSRRRKREATAFKNKMRRAGHLVGGTAADGKDDAKILEHVQQMKADAPDGHEVHEKRSHEFTVENMVKNNQLPVPSVIFMSNSTYGFTVAYVEVVDPNAGPADVDTSEMSDRDRDEHEWRIAADAHRQRAKEREENAITCFVLDTPQAELATAVLRHVAADLDEHAMSRSKELAVRMFGLESIEDLPEFAAKSSENLVRVATAAAVLKGYDKLEVKIDGDDEDPAPKRPDWSHYDDDGKFVGEQTDDDDDVEDDD